MLVLYSVVSALDLAKQVKENTYSVNDIIVQHIKAISPRINPASTITTNTKKV